MKKIALLFTILLFNLPYSNAQNAVDFSVNDCAGNPHHLFADLDAGKVVVITFVMPCVSCIGPANTGFATANNFGITDPGKVVFYLADNNGAPVCSVLTTWAGNNNLMGATCMSDPALKITDYGTMAMNKTVVLYGANHHVYYTEDYTLDSNNLVNTINSLLHPTDVNAISSGKLQFKVFPNPAHNLLYVNIDAHIQGNTTLQLINSVGQVIKDVEYNIIGGKGNTTVPFVLDNTLANGTYFLKLLNNSNSVITSFSVEK